VLRRLAWALAPKDKTKKGVTSQQSSFRLIAHWNQSAISGSSRIGMNSRFQAHFWIGKCSGKVNRDAESALPRRRMI